MSHYAQFLADTYRCIKLSRYTPAEQLILCSVADTTAWNLRLWRSMSHDGRMPPVGLNIRPHLLTSLRTTQALSRAEVIAKMESDGVSLKDHSLYQIEVGRRKPSPKVFLALCRALGLPEDRQAELLASESDQQAIRLRLEREDQK